MLMLISPAKKLDYTAPVAVESTQQPRFLDKSQQLVDILAAMAPHEISTLMHLSDTLGELNHDRYQAWQTPFTQANAKPALLAFKGDVYVGLDADSFSDADVDFAEQHLRILSGLYGLLRPRDLIQAYRLEMGTKLANPAGKDLYAFWGQTIATAVEQDVANTATPVVINLASNEYYKSVKAIEKKCQVITPVFKDKHNGAYKIISFYAKKARGLMAAYAVKQRITQPQQLQQFDTEGYCFAPDLSSQTQWVFVRDNTL